jgi:formylglycine-generating enzyme required for sulfatase activity
MTYENIDIFFLPAPNGYRVRLVGPRGGVATGHFQLPFAPEDLDDFVRTVGATRRVTRRRDSPQMESVRTFGESLFDALFQGDLRSRFTSILEENGLHGNKVCIRLHLIDTPELATLPWEFLYRSVNDSFLAQSTLTPLVRYVEQGQRIPALAVQPPLRILGIVSDPQGVSRLDVGREQANLNRAVDSLQRQGHGHTLEVEWLTSPTLAELQRALRRQHFHLFHFIGHGSFDEERDEGSLIFEDDRGRAQLVRASVLGALLRDHPTLRLAVLNACEGARTSYDDPFAGVAPALVRVGVPVVVAMQFEVSDQAAITFAEELYGSIVDGFGVYEAVGEARKAIFSSGNDVEWATPVIYSRVADGLLFDLPQVVPTGSTPAPRKRNLTSKRFLVYGLIGLLLAFVVLWGGSFLANQNFLPAAAATSTSQPAGIVLSGTPGATSTPSPRSTATDAIAVALAPTETPTPTDASTSTPTPTPYETATYAAAVDATLIARNALNATATASAPTATSIPTRTPTRTPTHTPTRRPPTNTPRPTPTPTLAAGAVREIDGIAFVYVPAGEFTMGSDAGGSDEKPVHTVYLDSYWVMRTEVTNAQYGRFVDVGGYATERFWTTEGWRWRVENNLTLPSRWTDSDFNGAAYPVVGVSWYEAVAYANWLAERTGLSLRLPTEAEWEKAARGTDGRIYPWGNEWSPVLANTWESGYGYERTAPVGSYANGASPYGALDMVGNVWEWANDWYDSEYYAGSSARNPPGPTSGQYRVLRGGSWYLSSTLVRAADRVRDEPDLRVGYVGFRLVAPGL